jgi:hypothetical protein
VRTAVGVALVTVCLGLAGCSLFGKKQAAQKNASKPFLGSEAPAKTETVAVPRDRGGPLPGANGLLAGLVVVEATDAPIKAAISIKKFNREDAKEADIDVSTDDKGYFTIPKLNAGELYLLDVRANENGELISRRVWVTPPAPAMLIRLDKRWTTASTPPPPDMPRVRDKKATAGTENAPEHKPTVSIDPPQTLSDPGPQHPAGAASPPTSPGSGAIPGGANSPNPANIADGGFRRITQPPSETVTIPSPPSTPSQPQWDRVPDQRQPDRNATSVPSGSVRLPYVQTPVPSCGLYGNRLDNFALHDLNGNVWEYKHDHRGRLMLLDFWATTCHYCLQDIHRLVELQRDYAAYGLEIVSIACETGTIEEQRNAVRPIRGRHNINYVTLLSGGRSCPVMGQFQVDRLPLLVLIDSDGTILWRSPNNGMDDNAHYALRKKINDRLITRQQPE